MGKRAVRGKKRGMMQLTEHFSDMELGVAGQDSRLLTSAQFLCKTLLEPIRAQFGPVRIHDGYRPWWVTKVFWDATPPADHDFVADPAKGQNGTYKAIGRFLPWWKNLDLSKYKKDKSVLDKQGAQKEQPRTLSICSVCAPPQIACACFCYRKILVAERRRKVCTLEQKPR